MDRCIPGLHITNDQMDRCIPGIHITAT
jgi:hypothetical protein